MSELPENIYDAEFLIRLFDEMTDTYERVSNITSFGFNLRWRRQLIGQMPLQPGMQVADFMGGGGESWRYILPRIGSTGRLISVDFSQGMTRRAEARQKQLQADNITVVCEDIFQNSFSSGSLDAVLSVYGVKTLSPELQARFVREIHRVLKPGGVFGLVEVSVPALSLLRLPYMFYLHRIIPVIGRLLLGNPENYRMLARYMEYFINCRTMERLFASEGFNVTYHPLFFGCASMITGRKPL